MKQFSFYVGIDVSKSWLDIALLEPSVGIIQETRINNDPKQIKDFLKTLLGSLKLTVADVLFCMEHTGRYGNPFLEVAAVKKANVWVELAVQIKRSQGLVRGKTDQWDARRIAEYAYRFSDRANLWKPADKSLEDLKACQSKRDLLIKTHTQLSQEDKNDPAFKKPLVALKKAIEEIDQQMESLLKENLLYLRQYQLLQTITGIGKQTAMALIIATHGFSRLNEAKKLSCFAGVAPFPYSSGSSIRGRSRISKMGNMKLKTLLCLCAWNAIRSTGDLKTYYLRKLQEGKHKLSIINAIKNKLLAIAIAVINRNQPFTKQYSVFIP